MSLPPPRSGDGTNELGRLHRCIRDLAALNALPSMCIGRSPDEAIAIVLDALPTALSCELVYLALPGSPARDHAMLSGSSMAEGALAELRSALGGAVQEADRTVIPHAGSLWCVEADVPLNAGRGRLVAGRSTPLDPATARILVRTAANIVGTTLESAQVLEAARQKDDFLAMLGHELRNPLAPILTAMELLGRHPEAAREQQVIERHTRHLARLVDNLLDISRVTRGHVELRNEQVSLVSVLERAVELAEPLMARQRHALRVASAEGVTLRGDPVRLAQIFGNLLTNAAKFTPARGNIDVLIERGAGRVRVAVRDNGRGIARDQLGRIFQPFVQAERDALRGGLGLGLAIVSDLVQRHGGTIAAESEGAGRGATFVVDLPTILPIEQHVEVPPAQPPTARSGVRVLVVDDNVDLAELLSEALRYAGFQTDVAYDAPGALEKWRRFAPQAAVLDVGLPEIDGYELAKTVRAEHGRDPMLIAATGYGDRKDRLRSADAGFDCHFVKPVSVQELLHVLDERVVSAAARRPGQPARSSCVGDPARPPRARSQRAPPSSRGCVAA